MIYIKNGHGRTAVVTNIVPVMDQLRPVASCAAVAFHKGLDTSAIRRETCDHPQGRHVIANLAWHRACNHIFLQLNGVDRHKLCQFGGDGSSEIVVIYALQMTRRKRDEKLTNEKTRLIRLRYSSQEQTCLHKIFNRKDRAIATTYKAQFSQAVHFYCR